jgi:excisionase family DNA binding protein
MTTKTNPWMTITEVCEDLGVGRSTIDDWRRTGRGPSFVRLPNGSLRIRSAAYHAWLETLAVV